MGVGMGEGVVVCVFYVAFCGFDFYVFFLAVPSFFLPSCSLKLLHRACNYGEKRMKMKTCSAF